MSNREHSPAGFSCSPRRVPCPGSLEMEKHYPNEETEASRTGTAAHEVLERLAKGDIVIAGKLAKNGELITDEMIAGAEMLLYDVDTTLAPHPEAANSITVEQQVAAPQIHSENYGTPDLWAFVKATLTLYVWEYKFGFSYVSVIDNYQLANQALAILNVLPITQSEKEQLTFVVKVVQPRFYGRGHQIRSYSFDYKKAMRYEDDLRNSYRFAYSGNAPIRSGPHCIDCPAAVGCEAFRRSVGAIFDYIDLAKNYPLSNTALAVQMQIVEDGYERIKYLMQAYELEAERRTRAGEIVPGRALLPGRPTKVWTAQPEEVAALGDLMQVNLRRPLEVKTPTQVINSRLIPAELLDGFYEVRQGELKLTKLTESQITAAFSEG